MPRIRRTELHRRRVRRKKLAKLKDRYARAETEADQATIREKIAKIAPWVASELPAGERAAKMATPPVDTPLKKRASPARRSGSPGPAQAESKGTESAEGRG
jgi:hypothetical protein